MRKLETKAPIEYLNNIVKILKTSCGKFTFEENRIFLIIRYLQGMSTAVVKMSLQNALRLQGTFDKDILHCPCFDTKRCLIISLFSYSGAIWFCNSDVLLPETSGSTDVELPPLTIYKMNVYKQL